MPGLALGDCLWTLGAFGVRLVLGCCSLRAAPGAQALDLEARGGQGGEIPKRRTVLRETPVYDLVSPCKIPANHGFNHGIKVLRNGLCPQYLNGCILDDPQ